jgi:hypothetical protein
MSKTLASRRVGKKRRIGASPKTVEEKLSSAMHRAENKIGSPEQVSRLQNLWAVLQGKNINDEDVYTPFDGHEIEDHPGLGEYDRTGDGVLCYAKMVLGFSQIEAKIFFKIGEMRWTKICKVAINGPRLRTCKRGSYNKACILPIPLLTTSALSQYSVPSHTLPPRCATTT